MVCGQFRILTNPWKSMCPFALLRRFFLWPFILLTVCNFRLQGRRHWFFQVRTFLFPLCKPAPVPWRYEKLSPTKIILGLLNKTVSWQSARGPKRECSHKASIVSGAGGRHHHQNLGQNCQQNRKKKKKQQQHNRGNGSGNFVALQAYWC